MKTVELSDQAYLLACGLIHADEPDAVFALPELHAELYEKFPSEDYERIPWHDDDAPVSIYGETESEEA